MSYYVRLLSPSKQIIYFSEIKAEIENVALVSGTDHEWTEIRIAGPSEIPIAILSRLEVSGGMPGLETLNKLKNDLGGTMPARSREWIRTFMEKVKTVYAFQLLTENLSTDAEWRTLGIIQNLHKDNLGGIIQSDREGYFNEQGDYILWQMYSGATGSVPAACLSEEGQWIPFQLKLEDDKAVQRFKNGELPPKSFIDVFFGRK
jgi:hypothetical protein